MATSYAVIKGVGVQRRTRADRPQAQKADRALQRPTEGGIACDRGTWKPTEPDGGGRPAKVSLDQKSSQGRAKPQSCSVRVGQGIDRAYEVRGGARGADQRDLGGAYHKVLPPTIGVESPTRERAITEAIRISTTTRWLHPHSHEPRRGGQRVRVRRHQFSRGSCLTATPAAAPAGIGRLSFVWRAGSRGLDAALQKIVRALDAGPPPSATWPITWLALDGISPPSGATLAIVAESLTDLRQKLATARRALGEHRPNYMTRGIISPSKATSPQLVSRSFSRARGAVPGMLDELAVAFPRSGSDSRSVDAALGLGRKRIGPLVYPPRPYRRRRSQRRQTSPPRK